MINTLFSPPVLVWFVPAAFIFGCWTGYCFAENLTPWNGRPIDQDLLRGAPPRPAKHMLVPVNIEAALARIDVLCERAASRPRSAILTTAGDVMLFGHVVIAPNALSLTPPEYTEYTMLLARLQDAAQEMSRL